MNPHRDVSYQDLMKPDEDWRMLPDSAERRKIQNRLAQRAYRRNMRYRCDELEKLKRHLDEIQCQRPQAVSVDQDGRFDDLSCPQAQDQQQPESQASQSSESASSNTSSAGESSSMYNPQTQQLRESVYHSRAATLPQQSPDHRSSMSELSCGSPLRQSQRYPHPSQPDHLQAQQPQQTSLQSAQLQPTSDSCSYFMQAFTSDFDEGCSPPFPLHNGIMQLSPDIPPHSMVFSPTDTPVNIGLNGASYGSQFQETRQAAPLPNYCNVSIHDNAVISSVAPGQVHATPPLTPQTQTSSTASSSGQYPCADDYFQVDKRCDQSLLHVAVRAGHEDVLRLLLQRGGIGIDCRDSLGMTALELAVWNGQMELVEILLDHGANMNAKLPAPPFDPIW